MPKPFIDMLRYTAHKEANSPPCAHNRGVNFKGQKLQKKFSNGGTPITQDYLSGIEYRNGSIEAIYFPEGRIAILSPAAGTTTPLGRYEYSIKDHLGNTRLTFADLNDNKVVDVPEDILQEQHYYPFGLGQDYSWMNNSTINDTKYLYNGKELNDEVFDASKRIGLNWMDYGARWYDASVARWMMADPMASKLNKWSPYNYCFNSPMSYTDPFGLEPTYDWQSHYQGNKGIYKDKGEEVSFSQVKSGLLSQAKLPKGYIVNVAGVSLDRMTNIANNAADIFAKNGFNGLSIKQRSVKEAKKYTETPEYTMFAAMLSNPTDGDSYYNGLSTVQKNGRIGVYDETYSKTEHWLSWVNLNAQDIKNNNDPDYAAGYALAHEFLHQMLGIASYYQFGDGTARFFSHSPPEYGPNLNREGTSTYMPNGPSKNLRPEEQILAPHREFLLNFLNSQKN
jgi:RHS repeat-associated protein